MTQTCHKNRPADPRQAARRKEAVDRRLEVDFFKALADATRVRLLACLVKCGRPCSVSEVAACCSVDFSVVARHLATLARAGVLEFEKTGRVVWYRACSDELARRLRELADAIDEWKPIESPSDPDADACGCRAAGDCCNATPIGTSCTSTTRKSGKESS